MLQLVTHFHRILQPFNLPSRALQFDDGTEAGLDERRLCHVGAPIHHEVLILDLYLL